VQRTQVGIIGAGPAGLMLSHLLHRAGIESVILEHRSREYVERRIRAGVLEQGTVELMREAGVADRLDRESITHDGVEIAVNGHRHRIDFRALTGRTITVYGQAEVTKDLIAARLDAGGAVVFEARDVTVLDADGKQPRLRYRHGGEEHELRCDFIAGCDGSHGISRLSIPQDALTSYEHSYPFAWLGILAEATPPSEELIYVRSDRGFALFSMRSPSISRCYLQCRPDENLEEWPPDRIWEELQRRAGVETPIHAGPIIDVSVTPLRSFVAEPMRYGRLFLAGDMAHIVPPTGAKGMNLAIADAHYLSGALDAYYGEGSEALLDAYSDTALRRVWKAERFSWWMTMLLHDFPDDPPFDQRVRLAELEYVLSSRAAQTALAENYVGLPL
jgi:p-hydroxybenzoate 3-monooxygenase